MLLLVAWLMQLGNWQPYCCSTPLCCTTAQWPRLAASGAAELGASRHTMLPVVTPCCQSSHLAAILCCLNADLPLPPACLFSCLQVTERLTERVGERVSCRTTHIQQQQCEEKVLKW